MAKKVHGTETVGNQCTDDYDRRRDVNTTDVIAEITGSGSGKVPATWPRSKVR